MVEILRHRRETRRQTDKANICLNDGKAPAYSPSPFNRRIIEDAEYRQTLTDHNFHIASRFFSYRVLRDSLRSMINNIRNLTE
jgi:hypothetical protein